MVIQAYAPTCNAEEAEVGFHRIIQIQLLWLCGWGIDLGYCGIEWFSLETNRNHSVIFETTLKYSILDSFVDYEGYSISSKGFLSTVVGIIVICIKFTNSSPF